MREHLIIDVAIRSDQRHWHRMARCQWVPGTGAWIWHRPNGARQAEAAGKSGLDLIDSMVLTKCATVTKAMDTRVEKSGQATCALFPQAPLQLPNAGESEVHVCFNPAIALKALGYMQLWKLCGSADNARTGIS